MPSTNIYCAYITHYSGDLMPPNYIGSSSVKKINNGYRGSVNSNKYKSIWKSELKQNPHLFSTEIISYHDTRREATHKELQLQRMLNVVKNDLFINASYATVNGFFGSFKNSKTEDHKRKYRELMKLRNYLLTSNGKHHWQSDKNKQQVSDRNKINNAKKLKEGTHNFQTEKHKQRVSEKNRQLSDRLIYKNLVKLFKYKKIPCPTGLNLKSDEFILQTTEQLLNNTYEFHSEKNLEICNETSRRNTALSSRELYIEVKQLYKQNGIVPPIGLNFKSNEFLMAAKIELTL